MEYGYSRGNRNTRRLLGLLLLCLGAVLLLVRVGSMVTAYRLTRPDIMRVTMPEMPAMPEMPDMPAMPEMPEMPEIRPVPEIRVEPISVASSRQVVFTSLAGILLRAGASVLALGVVGVGVFLLIRARRREDDEAPAVPVSGPEADRPR